MDRTLMEIDWNESTNHVLLNPRIPKRDRELYTNLLLAHPSLKRHLWVTTSGTTGKFKFVALSKDALLKSALAVNAHIACCPKDIWMHSLPSFHVGGIGICARSYISGATIVQLPHWNPESFVNDATQLRATLTALVPTQVYDIVKSGLEAPKMLRTAIVGGGALSYDLYTRAKALGWNLLPSYGLSECSSQVATAEVGYYDTFKILSHVDLKTDPEDFISIKSDSLLSCYAFINDRKVEFIDPKVHGWFKTEDKGKIADGYLKVFGRAGDFVKISGESVNMHALQNYLDQLLIERSFSAVLKAVADPRLGSKIILLVEGTKSLKLDDLIENYNQDVLPYERIHSVEFTNTIPRTPLGKVILNASEGVH